MDATDWSDDAFRNAPTAMLVADDTGHAVLANEAFAELTGFTLESMRDRPWPALFAQDSVEPAWELHREAIRRLTDPPPRVARLVRTDGQSIPIIIRARPLSRSGVVLVCSRPSYDDETVRSIAELRIESGDTALWSIDLRTGRLKELFGPSPLGRRLAGQNRHLEEFMARVHRDDVARLRDALASSYGGADYEQRFRMFDALGDERWLHARARYIGGDRPRLVGAVDDVTEHVQLIRRLADRRRMEDAQGRRVNELAAKLVSATTAVEIAGRLTNDFVSIFGGDTACILLDDEGEQRFYATSHTVGGLLAGAEVHDSSFPAGAVFQDRQPRFLDSRAEALELFPATRELLPRSEAQAWALVPILGDNRTALGVWQVTWSHPHLATPDERAVMLTLAGLAGQALQRVRTQQTQLELADALQRRMLPSQLPTFTSLDIAVRYLPARAGWRVCGDFYDAIRLPDNRIGLVVGDVQGHGVEAAAAMGQIRIAFRANAALRHDPAEVLAETNRMLSEAVENDDSVFATCGYLVLDLDTGEMRAAWAGQPPPVIATAESFEVWRPATGPPVGVDALMEYPLTTRVLQRGETLLMCSDGLVESSALTMDEGLEKVGQTLCGLATDVHAAATTLAELAPAGRGDDIALLLARMR